MKPRILGELVMAATLLLGAGVAGAATRPNAPATQSDNAVANSAVANKVRHEILVYPHYRIWDNIEFQVTDGNVVLTGAVTQPYKKTDLGRIVQHVPGVTSVTNQLEVLPLSPMDSQLRVQVARAIYSDPTLSMYANRALPPIHVIVDNGRVSLEGVVRTEMEKGVAGVRAASAGLSFGPITNNLRVEQPAKRG